MHVEFRTRQAGVTNTGHCPGSRSELLCLHVHAFIAEFQRPPCLIALG